MVTRVRSGARRRLAAPSRKRVWAREFGSFTGVSLESGQVLSLTSQFQADYGADLVGCTVARTFVQLTAIASVQVSPASGLAVAVIKAPATLPASDQEPLAADSRHLDWSLVKVFWSDPGAGTAAQLVGEVDLKAMRKLEELGESYNLVVQSATAGTEWNVQFYATTLLLLP